MAADPTYPLYPTVTILCSVLLLHVLLTSLARKTWNLGILTLCFWLFLENLTDGINAVMWADNADIKSVVYCDIGEVVSIVTRIIRPLMCVLSNPPASLYLHCEARMFSGYYKANVQRRNRPSCYGNFPKTGT
jgi:hypothetical protein